MVWEVVAMNTFYGYPVVENVDLATESSEIRIYNEGLPMAGILQYYMNLVKSMIFPALTKKVTLELSA